MAGGRPPKPSHLKLVSGTVKSHKKGAVANRAEPKPARWAGVPPPHLSPRAVACWGRVGPMLDRMGVLTEADELALAELCEAFADILKARASLANPVEIPVDGGGYATVAEGGALTYVTEGKSGPMLRSRPELTVIEAASRRFHSLLGQFGMTPAARSKVQVTDQTTAANPVDAYFGG